MALELPIAVYGNGELYQELFNAIAAALSDTAYGYLIKLSLCLTGTWAIVRYSAERSLMPLAKWLIIYYIAFYVVFMPKVTVEILDQVNQGKAYTVDNVPLGLAVVANLTSSMGTGLTRLTEKTFTLPDDLKYGQTGMVMASRLVLASTQFQVTNPDFQQSLQGFMHQCVFYDLLLNKYSWNDLITATDIWSFVGHYASPARAFAYYQPNRTQIMTCKDGFTRLSNDWKNAIQEAAARYGARLFPESSDAKAQLLSYLPDSYRFLTTISDDAATLMQQNMLANALQNGILQMGASTNSSVALEAYAFTKAQQQKRLTNTTIGDMAAYWVPIMKNVLEAILYGSFIFIFLLILFPFGSAIFKNYVASLMWLQLWAPLYAILNLFLSFYAQKHSLGALNLGNGGSGLTLSSQGGLAQVNADVAGLAGYLLLSVPLLAAGIVKGMMSVFTQAAQYIAGVTQGAASSAASDAVAGNFSLGNTNFSNHSSYNTSANHFDTNARVFNGMYTSQMPEGSSISMSPEGSLIMNTQGGISNLGTSVNVATTLRTAFTEQAEKSYTAAMHYADAYVSSSSSALRQLYDLAHQQGVTSSSGESSSIALSSGLAHAMSNINKLTERFAHDHNLSFNEASQYLREAYANAQATVRLDSDKSIIGKIAEKAIGAGASVSGSMGGRVSGQHSDGHNSSDLYSAAQDYIKDTHYSDSVDTALRAVSDHSYRVNSEEGQRLIDEISSSYENASQARHEMTTSLQAAQSYREGATDAEEHADSINSNASQVYFDYLQSTQGNDLRHIEKMQTKNPLASHAAGEEFVQTYVGQAMENWKQAHGVDPENVTVAYQKNLAKLPENTRIMHTNEINHKNVANEAHLQGLGEKNIVDNSIRDHTDDLILQNETRIQSEQSRIEQSGQQRENNAQQHIRNKEK